MGATCSSRSRAVGVLKPGTRTNSTESCELEYQRRGSSCSSGCWVAGRECEARPDAAAFRFAVAAGVQYGDRVSGTGWSGRYQHALAKLEHAARHWVSRKEALCFALHVGDLTAGNDSQEKCSHDLRRVLSQFSRVAWKLPVYHAFGAEASALSTSAMLRYLGLEGSYYSRTLPCNWRLVVLDTHQNLSTVTTSQNSPKSVVGVSETQLKWLRAQLGLAEWQGERVIVAAHNALHEKCSSGSNGGEGVGNRAEVHQILRASGATAVVLSGRGVTESYHNESGIHFFNVPSMVTSPAASIAPFFIFQMEGDKISVRGFGGLSDYMWKAREVPSSKTANNAVKVLIQSGAP